jgi:pseudouridine kinase
MSKSVLCIGATLVDELYFCEETIVPNSSNPAQKSTSIGGVISNIVQHLALLDVNVSLITALGSDADAAFIADSFEKIGIALDDSIIVEDSTGKYVSILNPDGSLNVAVCQDISFKYITIPFLESKADVMRHFDLIIIDTNLAIATIQWLITFAKANHKMLIIEPVSVTKAAKLQGLNLDGVYMITPNEEELMVMNPVGVKEEPITTLHQRGVAKIWLRKGNQGSVIHEVTGAKPLAVPQIQILDSTGAGDAALAGWIFGYVNNQEELTCLQLGHTLAFEILKIKGSVDFTLNKEKLDTLKNKYYHD